MRHSDHGMTKDEMAQDQPTDKARARATHKTDPDKSATRDPKLNDAEEDSRLRNDAG